MDIQTTTQISICAGKDWHYTVEDQNINVSCDGCTISYWQYGKRHSHITMEADEALAVADAIYKLFKKN